jgi:DNA-binding transcriptional ArsR family regulator
MNDTFQALANETRRVILDLVKDTPGLSVNDICAHFVISRIAVMKHLRILESADLLICQKVGKEKHHYFNVIPIQQIYERWTDQYSRFMAAKITDFKQQIEDGLALDEKEQTYEQQNQKKCS